MKVIAEPKGVRAAVAAWRRDGKRIAFVPTMGNLHAGHYALIDQARSLADRVVASIFVNPTQFGPGEDFERYPRTPGEDAEGLQAHDCDLLFMPPVDAIYPYGLDGAYRLSVPALTNVLCGAHRPGHFDGVVTVVSRLFNLVRPDVAVFGEKDFQQLRIIERMVEDLGYGIEIARGPTIRESDGLAMSSRNRYLTADQRQRAPIIRATLLALAQVWNHGTQPSELEAEGRERLENAGFQVDYLELRREVDLRRPEATDCDGLRIFVAAWLDSVRLIDNLAVAG